MTRRAVADAFERFLDRTLAAVSEEFSVVAALRGGRRPAGPAAAALDALVEHSDAVQRRVVEPELDRYRRTVREQFGVVLDYAASDADFEAYAEEVAATDLYLRNVRADVPAARRAALRERVLARHRRVGDRVRPLVAADADAFWPAVGRTVAASEATDLIEDTFRFTGPAVDFRDALAFGVEVDPGAVLGGPAGLLGSALPSVTVEFTDEAIRAMRRAERRVVARVTDEARRRFAEDDFTPAAGG